MFYFPEHSKEKRMKNALKSSTSSEVPGIFFSPRFVTSVLFPHLEDVDPRVKKAVKDTKSSGQILDFWEIRWKFDLLDRFGTGKTGKTEKPGKTGRLARIF